MVVSGQERSVEVVSRDGYEALRFVQDPVIVTAVARPGFGERPVFAVVDDLEPYMAEQRRFIVELAAVLGGMRATGQRLLQRRGRWR